MTNETNDYENLTKKELEEKLRLCDLYTKNAFEELKVCKEENRDYYLKSLKGLAKQRALIVPPLKSKTAEEFPEYATLKIEKLEKEIEKFHKMIQYGSIAQISLAVGLIVHLIF